MRELVDRICVKLTLVINPVAVISSCMNCSFCAVHDDPADSIRQATSEKGQSSPTAVVSTLRMTFALCVHTSKSAHMMTDMERL